MKAHLDLSKFIEAGVIANELDYNRAIIADRKLRLLAKENAHFKKLRLRLRDLIEAYEKRVWNDVNRVDENQIRQSNAFEVIAEKERKFFEDRKLVIRKKLKEYQLTQEALGIILGHKSKTHMSELINGIKPFTLKDLVIINQLFKIEFAYLIPSFLSLEDQVKVNNALQTHPQLRTKFTHLEKISPLNSRY